jgi:hypothetical protein
MTPGDLLPLYLKSACRSDCALQALPLQVSNHQLNPDDGTQNVRVLLLERLEGRLFPTLEE